MCVCMCQSVCVCVFVRLIALETGTSLRNQLYHSVRSSKPLITCVIPAKMADFVLIHFPWNITAL